MRVGWTLRGQRGGVVLGSGEVGISCSEGSSGGILGIDRVPESTKVNFISEIILNGALNLKGEAEEDRCHLES